MPKFNMRSAAMRGSIFAMACLMGLPLVAQEPPSQQSGQIALEEIELIVKQGGKLRERKKISLADEREVSDRVRKNPKKGETYETRPVKPKLRFLDSSGRAVKEIELGEKREFVKTRGGSIGRIRAKKALVSRSQRRAILTESWGEPGVESGETSRIQVMDDRGNVLWIKEMPKFRMVQDVVISEDGSTIATFQRWTEFDSGGKPDGAPADQIVVYNLDGNELTAFPKSDRDSFELHSGGLVVSPNGRFVGARTSKGRLEVSLFLDTQTGKQYTHEKSSYPVEISNDGAARVALMPGYDFDSFNLREKMQ